jgi:alpha-L-fucosidase
VDADMKNLKPTSDLIRKLADICSKGGNFLLNIGPRKDGTIPDGMVDRLTEMGKWVRKNQESIYSTSAGPFSHLSWGCATRKGDKLYLHVFEWPEDGVLRVPLNNTVKGAWLLTSPSEGLQTSAGKNRISIRVPARPVDEADTVVVLQIEGEPSVAPLPTAGATVIASSSDGSNVAANVLDGTGEKRWIAPKSEKSAQLEITLKEPTDIAGFGFDEPDVWPRLSQDFVLSVEAGGVWKEIFRGKTVGHGQVGKIDGVTGSKFRLELTCPAGAPGIAEFELYRPE